MRVATLACRDRLPDAVPPDLDGVLYVDDLCRTPAELTELIDGAERVVMLVHPSDLALALVQQSARQAGIDPLGLQYVSAASVAGDPARASLLLEGAAARAAAFTGSRPEHARPDFGGNRSRRELLSLPRPHYVALPLIDEDRCGASDGCRACVGECPQSAYQWAQGTIRFDRDACVTCGRCVTVCPAGAIGNPTVTNTALLAQIRALVAAAAPEVLGVAFVCRQRTRPISTPGWTEVELPCTGMAPATWPIAALLLGAAASAVIPCAASGCGLGNDQRALEAVAAAGGLLGGAGLDPALVASEPRSLTPAIGALPLTDPFGTHGPAEVGLALRSLSENALTVSGWAAGRGLVTLDEAACTLCLTCVETCPATALEHIRSAGQVSVTFDAALCTGCGQCVPACPEVERGAIRMEQRLDTNALSAGRVTVASSSTAACELCGSPIASSAMLNRISELLGQEHEAAMSYLERRCMDCRGAS